MFRYRMGFALTCAALTNGCLFWNPRDIASSYKQPREPAGNPLGGAGIAFKQPAIVPPSEMCTVPTVGLRDEYSITATSEEICIAGMLHFEGDEDSRRLAPVWRYQFASESGNTAPIQVKVDVDGNPRAISRCTGSIGPKIIWEARIKGCTANKGVLTATTKELALRMFARENGTFYIGGEPKGLQGNEVQAWTFTAMSADASAK